MALTPMNLRLEAADGSGLEEYRIRNQEIEIRKVRATSRHSEQPANSDWRPLTAGEIADHVQSHSVVAQWLLHRIGWRRLILASTDRETLNKFGVAETISDRFAA